MAENILLTSDVATFDIDFSKLTPQMFIEAFDILLSEADKEFSAKVKAKKLTYKELSEDVARERLMAVTHVLGNLNALIDNEEYRDIEEKYTGIISVKMTEWALSSKMYKKIQLFSMTKEYQGLSDLRKKMIQKILKDLRTGGVDLPSKDKKVLAKINRKTSQLVQKFQNNITDAQDSIAFIVKEKDLKGLPERSLNNAKEIAKQKNLPEGKFYIDEPSGLVDDAFTYSKSEALRKKIYLKRRELCTTGKFNNTKLIDKIYKLKNEVAHMLGYQDFAHMMLEDNMAKTPSTTLDFINKLGNIALPHAKKETELIREEAKKILGREMNWWDGGFVVDKITKEKFDIDPEEVRLYFPVDKVMNGLFELCKSLFDVSFVENKNKHTWHPDAKYYDVFEGDNHIGGLFMDIYKRAGKTPGAWLDPVCAYENNDIRSRKPVAVLVCNAPQDAGQTSTFEMYEVVTLFHEMGHALHHLLCKVEEEFFSGLHQVEHDAVEIPSQLMENFVYEREVLKKLTSHVKTGEQLPDELIEKIIKNRKFLGASEILNMVRYSEMDMRLYMQNEAHPYEIEAKILKKWKVNDNYDKKRGRMAVFSHIFGGGYSAGYYAYQWAEVYAADGYKYLASGSEEDRKSVV